jgi:hypothetical protein
MKLKFGNEEIKGSVCAHTLLGSVGYEITFRFKHIVIAIHTRKKTMQFFTDFNILFVKGIESLNEKYKLDKNSLEKELQDIIYENYGRILKCLIEYHKEKIENEEIRLKEIKDKYNKMMEDYSGEIIMI